MNSTASDTRPATDAQRNLLHSLGHELNQDGDYEVGGMILRAADSTAMTFYQATKAIPYAKRAAAGFAVDPDGWVS